MKRVVVTGLGAVSPCGLDVPTTWASLKAARSGIGRITLFDSSQHAVQFAGECWGFEVERHVPRKEVRTMDRFIHLAMGAADEALASARIVGEHPLKENLGTLIGVGMGGLQTIENTARVLVEKGPSKISPYFIPATISNLAAGQVSIKHGLKGESYATTSACASGAHAVGEAFRAIARGELTACLAGGAEAVITPLGVGGFAAMRALSRRNAEPTRASRPWDVDRDGFVIAEGAGLLLLEDRDQALAREAKIYAEVVGYGASSDAYHLTTPAPEGEGAQRAIRAALRDARLNPEQVDYVNAHGTSTPAGDMLELAALRRVFGDHIQRGLWVSSTKSMTGHLLGAAGGLEAVICALALAERVVPPTINLEHPEPEAAGFDLVPHEARQRTLNYVLSNSFGFGGTNASILFARHD
ncbi:MAG: beta-ketoacyl-ACP synthase II [Myxococcales bacterium]